MLEEQREIDQNRFQERFGVDLENIENIDPNGHDEDENKKRSGKKQSTMERVAFKPYNRQFRLRGRSICNTNLYDIKVWRFPLGRLDDNLIAKMRG